MSPLGHMSEGEYYRVNTAEVLAAAKEHDFTDLRALVIQTDAAGYRQARAFWSYAMRLNLQAGVFGWPHVEGRLQGKQWMDVAWSKVERRINLAAMHARKKA